MNACKPRRLLQAASSPAHGGGRRTPWPLMAHYNDTVSNNDSKNKLPHLCRHQLLGFTTSQVHPRLFYGRLVTAWEAGIIIILFF